MKSFTLHPNVYNTDPNTKGLVHMLEYAWIRKHKSGDGTFFIISGFANYNGGVRFYNLFKKHIEAGGNVIAIFGGSTAQRLSTQQIVEQMLEIGVKVYIVNRKRLLHAKCYGTSSSNGQTLVVTSGNFTGPGMSQNVEASLMLDGDDVVEAGFKWEELINNILRQKWDLYKPTLSNKSAPAWKLLYDEVGTTIKLDETQTVTMIMSLGHADTARIQATSGSPAGLGSQYFWLSKDSYDFFPPLTIRNKRGHKATYSTIISLKYVDLGITDNRARVTFEAENNFDFRLGTGKLRYTKLAKEGDLAVITRKSETDYELKIIKKGSKDFNKLNPFTINFIGYQGKKYGYIANDELNGLLK